MYQKDLNSFGDKWNFKIKRNTKKIFGKVFKYKNGQFQKQHFKNKLKKPLEKY